MGNYQNHILTMEMNKMHLDVSRAFYVELNSRWKYRKNASAHFTRIYLVTEGEADILCDNKPYKLLPGNIYVIPGGTPLCYDCKERLCKLYFQVNLFSSMGEDIPIAPPGCIVLEERGKEIAEITKLYRRKDYAAALAVRQMVERTLFEAMSLSGTDLTIPHYSAPIRKILRLMGQAPSMAMTVPVLAEKVYLSPAVFQKKFREEVGMTPIKYLRQRVIAAAEKDLKTGDLSLREISEKYGFCDQFHFSRVFTEKCGVPPSRYRKDHII